MITPDITSPYLFKNNFPPSGIGVVIHATRSGKPGNPTELEGTLNWFNNPASQVSSHWVIGRDGTKARVVIDRQQAWHAGEHNATHWGIEVCQAVDADGYTEVQLSELAKVCAAYAKDFSIAIVHDFHGFIGHEETPQGRRVGKTDPGTTFPWDRFLDLVKNGGTPNPNRVWLYGNEMAGLELRGKQQFIWNQGVEVDAIGDFNGDFPGQHWHNQGGQWVQILP